MVYKKIPRGRKPKDGYGNGKKHVLTIRLSDAEFEDLNLVSSYCGMSFADTIRRLIRRANRTGEY